MNKRLVEFGITVCKSHKLWDQNQRDATEKASENKAHFRRELLSSYRYYTKTICLGGSREENEESSSSEAGEENESSDAIVTLNKALVGRTVPSITFLILLCWALTIITTDYFLKMWCGLMKARLANFRMNFLSFINNLEA